MSNNPNAHLKGKPPMTNKEAVEKEASWRGGTGKPSPAQAGVAAAKDAARAAALKAGAKVDQPKQPTMSSPEKIEAKRKLDEERAAKVKAKEEEVAKRKLEREEKSAAKKKEREERAAARPKLEPGVEVPILRDKDIIKEGRVYGTSKKNLLEHDEAKEAQKQYQKDGQTRLFPDLSKYVRVKTASGRVTMDNGDHVANLMRNATELDDVYRIAETVLGAEATKAARLKYKKLNPGMQRMNMGNKMRTAMLEPERKKAEAEARAIRDAAKKVQADERAKAKAERDAAKKAKKEAATKLKAEAAAKAAKEVTDAGKPVADATKSK